MIKGYAAGVFDLFHIGHLNILQKAKEQCDYLIVGLTTDELCFERKKIKPFIPFFEREQILKSIRFVDDVVPQKKMDKFKAWEQYKFDRLFVGDDWRGTQAWTNLENELQKVGCEVIYFPYTESTSSTQLRILINKNITSPDLITGSIYHDI